MGFYFEDSLHDNSEYHAVRNGVDQMAIHDLFVNEGMDCVVIEYCSLHSNWMQPFGEKLRIKNTFAIVAGHKLPTYDFL